MVWVGRAQVLSALHISALSASKYNSSIKLFYKRLIEKEKKPKVALTTCIRKILTILDTMVKIIKLGIKTISLHLTLITVAEENL